MQRNREAVPEAARTKTSHTSGDTLNQGTIPVPTFATRPWTKSSTMPVELPQNYIVGQQRQQISELEFDKFLNPQSFLVWGGWSPQGRRTTGGGGPAGPEPACVQTPSSFGMREREGEGRKNVRGNTSSESHKEEVLGCPQG